MIYDVLALDKLEYVNNSYVRITHVTGVQSVISILSQSWSFKNIWLTLELLSLPE